MTKHLTQIVLIVTKTQGSKYKILSSLFILHYKIISCYYNVTLHIIRYSGED